MATGFYVRRRFTAPVGGVIKGTAYLIGSLLVVARANAAAAAFFTAAVGGRWTLAKTSAQAWTEGQKLYWNVSTSKLDSDGTTGPLVGTAAAIAANPSATGDVLLSGVPAATSEGPQTVIAAITGTLTGTADGAMVDVAATAAATAGGSTPTAAQVDTGIAAAVASIVTGVNTQNKELLTKLNEVIAALKAAGVVASA